jgi:AcrR family transcriptional regulator
MSTRSKSYERIVNAAEVILVEGGASHMTIDAVAKKAGVSRGGFFYHFPTKDLLLEAMINRTIRAREESRQRILSGLSPSGELKAYILNCSIPDQKLDCVGITLLAALAHDPKLAKLLREAFKTQYDKVAPRDVEFARAAVLALAASPFAEEQRSRILDRLLKLADSARCEAVMGKRT